MTEMHLPGLPKKPRNFFSLGCVVLVVLFYLCIKDLDVSFSDLSSGVSDIGAYISQFKSPDFSGWQHYYYLMWQTIATAFWGTVIAFVLAVPLAPFAARKISPNRIAYRITREVMGFSRSMPDLLLGLVFVAAIGLGPLAGALALGIHMAGFFAKFLAESMERVEPGVYEALRASGASFLQTVMYAGWPSIAREVVGYALYVFDRNVRSASVLGLIGAGGIGMELQNAIRLFNYDQASALILVNLTAILALDYISAWLRGKIE